MAARRGEQASLHLPIASRAMPIPGRADLPIASRASLHLSGKNKSIIGLNRKIADKKYWLESKYLFLTVILHCGLRNDFFLLLFAFSFWTFISLFSLDFYFPFLFGLLFPFSN